MKIAEILNRDLTGADMPQMGLSTAFAQKRLKEEGTNALVGKKKKHPAAILAAQFKDVLVLILLVCTAVSVFMGEYTEAIAIAVIVLTNAAMGAVQEYKTEKTLEALKKMSAPRARVLRDGRVQSIPAAEIVREDVIELEAGDRVPADAVILSQKALCADEAMLTGESVPVEKSAASGAVDAADAGRDDCVYMGTTITKGKATARVLATGMSTQMGRIAGMLEEIEQQQTPLQKRLEQLGKWIGIGCLLVCAIVSLTGILRGEGVLDMLITGVSLAVAAVPEGLPAIVTISLALAVGRMVKKKALIRKLHAVETLGCASVICSDKTGTLTQNKMTVKQIALASHTLTVSGDGYQKAGGFFCDKRPINLMTLPAARRLLEIAVLCNNASLSDATFGGRDRAQNKARGRYEVLGDPTEAALLVAAGKAGIFKESLSGEYEILEEIPFDSERKRMSVAVQAPSGRRLLLVKGAFDILLERAQYLLDGDTVRPLDHAARVRFQKQNAEMAQDALRVLGFAYRELSPEELPTEASERNLVFVGLSGMLDPPRPEAKKAVRLCAGADIKTVMITGDHKDTACAIAKALTIYKAGDLVVTGAELDRMDDETLFAQIPQITVFARVNPDHKLRIVRAFKRRGHIVAMTGDGVNDAPAVKEADIGVSMGESGTDVTKQAADVILLDDNFATLVSAVEEGRVIYSNIRKFIRYLLSCNVGEVLTMFLGMLMGMPTVLLPIQILVINLVTDGLPAIALGLEPSEKNIMKQKPRRADESVFANGLLSRILFRGALIGLTTLAVFTSLYKQTGDVGTARTGAFVTLVLTQLLHVFECKSEQKNIFTVPYFNNPMLLGAVAVSIAVVLGILYLPFAGAIFSTVPLKADQLLLILLYALSAPVLTACASGFSRKKILKG